MIAAKMGIWGDSWQLSVKCSSDSSFSVNLNFVDFRGGPNCRWKLSRDCCDNRTEGSCVTEWTMSYLGERNRKDWEHGTKNLTLLGVHLCNIMKVTCHYPCLYVQVFCDPMNCIPPGSSGHGISLARILEWVLISSSRGSYWPRDQTHIFCIGRQILYHWAIPEVPQICLFFPLKMIGIKRDAWFFHIVACRQWI